MKSYPMPANFSGAKFAARYKLDAVNGDFWSDGKSLFVPDNLPDDPPIFETPDPPQPTELERMKADIETLKTKVAALETDIKPLTAKLPK